VGKLIWLALLVSLAAKALTGRWPWELWRAWTALPPSPEERARRLLGVAAQATREEITTAHRNLVSRVHPDRGGTTAEVQAANEARDCLLARLG
jgi:hypothetical protein